MHLGDWGSLLVAKRYIVAYAKATPQLYNRDGICFFAPSIKERKNEGIKKSVRSLNAPTLAASRASTVNRYFRKERVS